MGKWCHWKYLKTSQLHPWCVTMFWPLPILHEGFSYVTLGHPNLSHYPTLFWSGGVLSGFKGLRSEVTIIPTCSFFSDEAHARSGKWNCTMCTNLFSSCDASPIGTMCSTRFHRPGALPCPPLALIQVVFFQVDKALGKLVEVLLTHPRILTTTLIPFVMFWLGSSAPIHEVLSLKLLPKNPSPTYHSRSSWVNFDGSMLLAS